MGKYDETTRENLTGLDNGLLRAVANELAEANRLKRIELREKLAIHRKIQFMVDETELDDKA